VPQRIALDTNIYIHALRQPERLAALKRFLRQAGDRVHLHAIVALELRAGVRDEAQLAGVDGLVRPYQESNRIVLPTFEAFMHAGRVLCAVAQRERIPLGDAPRSFTNDVLIATSCRETGTVLITENARDFTAIQRHLRGFKFLDRLGDCRPERLMFRR
jgi:predicted nucleic acid-binding protein